MSTRGHSRARLLRRGLALVALGLAWMAAVAQAQGAGADEVPPRVGRVAFTQGELYIAPPDHAQEWAPVARNHPVVTGDNLWMSGDGRAEVDYGGGQLRLGPDSNVQVSRLDEQALALFVAEGRVIVRVRYLAPGEATRIDTPNAQIDLVRPGLYRIDVSPQPRQTWVVVRLGEASVALPGAVQPVLPGQTASIAGTADAVAEVREGAGVDGLDTWSAERDRVYERSYDTAAYVSRQMVGYADLESNGRWQTYPDYGAVWFPERVAPDWAPYRYGHWVWLVEYGWTWVDDAAWGYAPFHYGRWAFIGGRWGWCPGAFVARPMWAPALVAWYGGSGWTYFSSFSGPVFGWVPLGWRDPFVPWWGRCGTRCYDRYNRPYAVDVRERPRQPPGSYANARVPNAVTAVSAAALRETRPVQTSRVELPPQAIATAPRLSASPQVRPVVSSTRVVQPGRGAPQPAGEIAARIRPQAVSPFSGAAAAEGRGRATAVPPAGGGPAGTRGAGPVNAVPPAGARPAGTRAAGALNAVPPAGAAIAPSTRAPSGAPRERITGGVNAVPPAGQPPLRSTPAPTEPSIRATPSAPLGPPTVRSAPAVRPAAPVQPVPPVRPAPSTQPAPSVRSAPAPSAPVAAVPPAAAHPQPQLREAPVPRPGQQPSAPRPGQN